MSEDKSPVRTRRYVTLSLSVCYLHGERSAAFTLFGLGWSMEVEASIIAADARVFLLFHLPEVERDMFVYP